MTKSASALFSERFTTYGRDSIVPPCPSSSWEDLMRIAIREALSAEALGEVPVGAVVIDQGGAVLGAAHNSCIRDHDVSAHAEISALRQAGQAMGNYRLPGCYLVVTLEPCCMCAQAIVSARLAGLVFGARDCLAGAVVSNETLPTDAFGGSIWYMGGVLGDQCAELLRSFFARRR